jgi:5-methylthioadenosine/S-adenosylhomocysteine deaminase
MSRTKTRTTKRRRALKALLAELRAAMPEFLEFTLRVEAANRQFEPYFSEVIRRCYAQDLGIMRWASDGA